MKDDEIEIAVQINGKTRAVVSLPAEISKEEALEKGKEAVKDKLTGTIVKEIYVPGRIINIVQEIIRKVNFHNRIRCLEIIKAIW